VFPAAATGTVFRVGEKVVTVGFDGERDKVFCALESGKKIRGQALLYTIGRHANSDKMKIEAAGLAADERGKLAVNENFQTAVPHIYAAGDVIGFPALGEYFDGAGAACELSHVRQAQPAAVESDSVWHLHHSGNIDGRGHGRELTRSKIRMRAVSRAIRSWRRADAGRPSGAAEILFDPDTLKLLGVHIIGERAAEIVHIGQAVLTMGATIEYFAIRCSTIRRWRKRIRCGARRLNNFECGGGTLPRLHGPSAPLRAGSAPSPHNPSLPRLIPAAHRNDRPDGLDHSEGQAPCRKP